MINGFFLLYFKIKFLVEEGKRILKFYSGIIFCFIYYYFKMVLKFFFISLELKEFVIRFLRRIRYLVVMLYFN